MVRPTRAVKTDSAAATPAKKAVNGSQSGRKRKSGSKAGRPAKPKTPTKSLAKKAKKEEESYDVEEVRGIQTTKTGDTKILIKWANYPEKENSWEPIGNVSCAELVKKFLNNALANVQDDKEAEEEEEEAAA